MILCASPQPTAHSPTLVRVLVAKNEAASAPLMASGAREGGCVVKTIAAPATAPPTSSLSILGAVRYASSASSSVAHLQACQVAETIALRQSHHARIVVSTDVATKRKTSREHVKHTTWNRGLLRAISVFKKKTRKKKTTHLLNVNSCQPV